MADLTDTTILEWDDYEALADDPARWVRTTWGSLRGGMAHYGEPQATEHEAEVRTALQIAGFWLQTGFSCPDEFLRIAACQVDKADPATPQRLADAFAAVIREWLTPEELALAVERNLTYGPGICATHDFCDANMAMDEAWQAFFGSSIATADEQGEAFHEADCILWSTAWDLAKASGFAA